MDEFSRKKTALLFGFGFRQVGHWKTDGAFKSGVGFDLTALANDRTIYAFAVDGEIKYIGVCESTETTLTDRMTRYRGKQGGGTNERVLERIGDSLSQNREVAILAWKPATTMEILGISIDLVKGLENPLIDLIDPEWNIRR